MKKLSFFVFIVICSTIFSDLVTDLLTGAKIKSLYLENTSKEKKEAYWKRLSLSFEKSHPFKKNLVPIDILIPATEKDFDVLPYTIIFARKNILHPIGNIFIVSPISDKITKIASDYNCLMIDENSVLPITLSDIHYLSKNGLDRRGWLFQQLLKLSADVICQNENILLLDSDTLIARPQTFIYENKIIFNCSNYPHHTPYHLVYKKITNHNVIPSFSFVTHHMLVQKSNLKKLKEEIEKLHNDSWYNVIISLADKNDSSGFSEYETYGQFMLRNYPDQILQLYWFNLELSKKKDLSNYLKTPNFAEPHIKSCSFHSYFDE